MGFLTIFLLIGDLEWMNDRALCDNRNTPDCLPACVYTSSRNYKCTCSMTMCVYLISPGSRLLFGKITSKSGFERRRTRGIFDDLDSERSDFFFFK